MRSYEFDVVIDDDDGSFWRELLLTYHADITMAKQNTTGHVTIRCYVETRKDVSLDMFEYWLNDMVGDGSPQAEFIALVRC